MTSEALLYCCQTAPDSGYRHRALAIADALSEHFRVTVALDDAAGSNGIIPPDVSTVTVRTHAPADVLPSLLEKMRPRVIVIEGFPVRDYDAWKKILPFVQAARSGRLGQALVACVTDGLLANYAAADDDHSDGAAEILDRHFDIAVVRSDPVFARLEEFFRPANTLHTPLYHVGFVNQYRGRRQPATGQSDDGILVTASNDDSSMALYKHAIAAYRTLRQSLSVPMTMATRKPLSARDLTTLQALAADLPEITLPDEPIDISAAMTCAKFSISQCGYSAAVDAIRSQTPSLFVPSTDENPDEQIERAKRLVYWGAGRLLMPRHLNTASLVNEIHQLTKFEPRGMSFDLNGAANAAQLIAQIAYNSDYTPVFSRPHADKRLH